MRFGMSILHRRRFLNAIIALSLLAPLISVAQVTIKEKVEIKPKTKVSSTSEAPLKMTFHWGERLLGSQYYMMHLGVIEPSSQVSGFDPFTGSPTGDYTERITAIYTDSLGSINYYGQSTCTIPRPYSGQYILSGSGDVGSTPIPYWGYFFVRIQAEGVVDTTVFFPNKLWTPMYDKPYFASEIYFTFAEPPSGPCSGANFQIGDITDVQHGEHKYIWVSIVDDCGSVVSTPPEYFYKYELLGDAGIWGFLRDPITGRTGAILDSVNSTNIEFDAWGKDSDSVRVLSIRVSAENGSITPATAAFTLLPPEVRVLAGKTTLAFGDTTLLTMQVRYSSGAWMDRPYNWKSWFAIAQQDTFGSLRMLDSTDYNPDVNEYESSVVYYSHPQVAADSDEVLILLSASEPSSGDEGIRVPVVRDRSTVSQQLRKKISQPNSTTAATKKKGDAISVRDNPSSHFGLARLKLRRSQILLGETKYYYVKNDNGSVSIEETTNQNTIPAINDANVWPESPVSAVLDKPNSGKRLGVYWETQKPISNGTNLAPGMIRLVGRHWRADSVYKVDLAATYNGNTLHKVVEAKKPARLLKSGQHPTYQLSRDVFNNPIDVDSLCVYYGDLYGIPPHFLKGQMLKEAGQIDIPGDKGFAPSYRYEPFSRWGQLSDVWTDEARYRLWLVDPERTGHEMGTGKDVPTHQNVCDMPYPTTPKTVWDILAEHSELVTLGAGPDDKAHRVYGSRNGSGKMVFPKEYEGIRREYSKLLKDAEKEVEASTGSKEEIARQYMIDYLHDEWGDGGATNMVAQTRLASSYGLLQMMYGTAVWRLLYPTLNANISPEDLNVTDVGMSYCLKSMKRFLQDSLTTSVEEKGNWPKGFEYCFKTFVWPLWNPDRQYPGIVFSYTQKFVPQDK